MDHRMSVEEVREARQKLLDDFARFGLSEPEVYEYAETWSLRPLERAKFQTLTDYDWILSVVEEHRQSSEPAAA